MRLHTVIVSFNRLELLQRTIASYYATVEGDATSMCVVDNGSEPETREWLQQQSFPTHFLHVNAYPGYAANLGFAYAPPHSTFLHRSDNDMEYLPGWCQAARERFGDAGVGQVGLRTNEEELYNIKNVGGTAIFRRSLWDDGLRYRTESWAELGAMTEDYWISVAVEEMGYKWTRVRRPCVVHIATGDMEDPYYQESYGIRGFVP